MNLEKQTDSNDKENAARLTRRGKAVLALIGVGLSASALTATAEANTSHFSGEQRVTITESTVTGIAEDHVKGASADIQDTVQKIVDMNPQVFQDGKAVVESQDVGKSIEVPESVSK